jgi:hypothetical protein
LVEPIFSQSDLDDYLLFQTESKFYHSNSFAAESRVGEPAVLTSNHRGTHDEDVRWQAVAFRV